VTKVGLSFSTELKLSQESSGNYEGLRMSWKKEEETLLNQFKLDKFRGFRDK
jgi:hypothetical protein